MSTSAIDRDSLAHEFLTDAAFHALVHRVAHRIDALEPAKDLALPTALEVVAAVRETLVRQFTDEMALDLYRVAQRGEGVVAMVAAIRRHLLHSEAESPLPQPARYASDPWPHEICGGARCTCPCQTCARRRGEEGCS